MRIEVDGPLQESTNLVARVFSGLEEEIPKLSALISEGGGRIRMGEPPGPWIQKIADELSVVFEGYQQGRRLLLKSGMRREPAGTGGESGQTAVRLLESGLKEILSALESGDVVRMGDAMEYELTPALSTLRAELQGWLTILPGAGEEVEQSGAEN